MENSSGYHVPFYVVTGGVATSGHSADLTPGKVGIFDRQTFSVATSSGNGKEFFLAQGRIGGLDWYGEKVTESHKSAFFYGDDIEKMWMVKPNKIQNEEWVVGYNGADSDVGISFKTGKRMGIKFLFQGEPSYRFFNGPKEYVVSYTPLEDCATSDCADGCADGALDCEAETIKLINKINNHTELKKFGVQARLKTTGLVATTPNMEKFKLSVCDNGDSVALAAVQSQYPLLKVERTSRVGSTSVYEVCVVGTVGDDTPAAFTQSGSISYAVCGDCPTGSVVAPAQDVYFISRPLTGTEDFTSDASKLAYARTVAAAYFGKTFNATSGVDDSTETITVTGHGFSAGQAVVFSVATGLIVGGITAGTTYYVIAAGLTANAFRVSATRGGSAVNLTDAVGTNTVTPTPAVFIAQDGAVATIKVTVPSGITVTALLADSVNFSHSTSTECVFPAPSSISWVANGTGVRAQRTMKISGLNRNVCDLDGDRVSDLQMLLGGIDGMVLDGDDVDVTVIEGEACADDYTVTQWSNDCLSEEACLTNPVTFHYADLPAFEGRTWVDVTTPAAAVEGKKCGIIVTAGYQDIQFGNCGFDPTDYYEVMPVKMEVSYINEEAGTCDNRTAPTVTQTRLGKISRASGEYVIREATSKLEAYQKDTDQFSLNPRMREAFDMNILDQVDRKAYYKLYYVQFKASYGTKGMTRRKGEQEGFVAVFAVKETDPIASTLESSILNVLTAKSGVTLEVID